MIAKIIIWLNDLFHFSHEWEATYLEHFVITNDKNEMVGKCKILIKKCSVCGKNEMTVLDKAYFKN